MTPSSLNTICKQNFMHSTKSLNYLSFPGHYGIWFSYGQLFRHTSDEDIIWEAHPRKGIKMIDLTIHKKQLDRTVERARERGIIIPTIKQQMNPSLIPNEIKSKITKVGLWDIDPLNLFRITWKNEPVDSGGKFGNVNC